MTAHSMLLQASPEPASVPGVRTLGKLCQLAAAHQAVLFSETGTGTGCISTPVSQRSFLYIAFSERACLSGCVCAGPHAGWLQRSPCRSGRLHTLWGVIRHRPRDPGRPFTICTCTCGAGCVGCCGSAGACNALLALSRCSATTTKQHIGSIHGMQQPFSRAACAGTPFACHVHEKYWSTWHGSGQLILTAGRIWGASNAPAQPHLAPAALQAYKTLKRWHPEPPQRLAVPATMACSSAGCGICGREQPEEQGSCPAFAALNQGQVAHGGGLCVPTEPCRKGSCPRVRCCFAEGASRLTQLCLGHQGRAACRYIRTPCVPCFIY